MKGGSGTLCGTAISHQRKHRHCLHIGHLAGDHNVMADNTSCFQELTDPTFLAHFEQFHSQEHPWQLLQPRPTMVSRLISDVLGQRTSCRIEGREMQS